MNSYNLRCIWQKKQENNSKTPAKGRQTNIHRKDGLFNKKYIFAPVTKHFTMSDIATRVKKIIVDKLGVDEGEVTNEASFTNDLGADSLDTVELIMEFEKEFNISIPDEQAETITTVGQAVAYLEEHAK